MKYLVYKIRSKRTCNMWNERRWNLTAPCPVAERGVSRIHHFRIKQKQKVTEKNKMTHYSSLVLQKSNRCVGQNYTSALVAWPKNNAASREVEEAMAPLFIELFFSPSQLHNSNGQRAVGKLMVQRGVRWPRKCKDGGEMKVSPLLLALKLVRYSGAVQ